MASDNADLFLLVNSMKSILTRFRDSSLLLREQKSLPSDEMSVFTNLSPFPPQPRTIEELEILDLSNFSFSNTIDEHCYDAPINFLEEKKWITFGFGTFVAVLSIILNSLLMYVFATRKRLRFKNLYTMALSVCDIALAVLFLLVLDLVVVAVWMDSVAMYRVWESYIIPAFALGHVIMAVSTFLIVAASIDRYIATMDVRTSKRLLSIRLHKGRVVLVCILVALVLRGTIVFEIHFEQSLICADGFQSQSLSIKNWVQNSIYATIWRFYIRHIFNVFLPFVLLVYFNYVIVAKLKRDQIQGSFSLHPKSTYMRIKKQTRSATKMLVLIVSSYLIVNTLNFLLTAWEHIDIDSLRTHSKFYELATDVVSVLSIASGAIRLPIYALINKAIRKELKDVVRGLLACAWFESDNAKMLRIKRYSHQQVDDDLSGPNNEPNSVWFRRNAVSTIGSYDSSSGRDELIHVRISTI